jgi:hypothetical protein
MTLKRESQRLKGEGGELNEYEPGASEMKMEVEKEITWRSKPRVMLGLRIF